MSTSDISLDPLKTVNHTGEASIPEAIAAASTLLVPKIQGTRSSQPPILPNQRARMTINTGSGSISSSFPAEVLGKIFEELRENVGYTEMPLSSFPNRGDTFFVVGPPVTITRVNRTWRSIALSTPLLWTSFTISLEHCRSLVIGNPGQLEHHLRYSGSLPLSIIVGSFRQLSGSGISNEHPTVPRNLDFLDELAPRVRNLALVVDLDSKIHLEFFKATHEFSTLEQITLHGTTQTRSPLNQAGFWKSPRLRSVIWSIFTRSHPPILSSHWLNLTELVLSETSETTVPAAILRFFLSLATKLVRLQCRVGYLNTVRNDYGSIPLADEFRHSPLPILHHRNLQTLRIMFDDQDMCGTGLECVPAVLHGFNAPQLHSMSYGVIASVIHNPASAILWLCMGNHHHLTHFECLVGTIDLLMLLQGIRAMTTLEVFKWVGVVTTNVARQADVLSSDGASSESYAFVGDTLLKYLAHPWQAPEDDAKSLSDTLISHITSEEWICPRLKEVHIGYAIFTNDGIESLFKGRMCCPDSRDGIPRPTPLKLFTIGVLLCADLEKVYEMRQIRKVLSTDYGACMTVDRYVDGHFFTLCGPDYDPSAWYAVGPIAV